MQFSKNKHSNSVKRLIYKRKTAGFYTYRLHWCSQRTAAEKAAGGCFFKETQ